MGILAELGLDPRGERGQVLGDGGPDAAVGEVVGHPGENDAPGLRREPQHHLQRAEHVTVLGHPGDAALAPQHRFIKAVQAHEHDGHPGKELGTVCAGEVERGVVRGQHDLERLRRELGTQQFKEQRSLQQARVVYRVQVLDPQLVLGGEGVEDGIDALLLRARPRKVRAVGVENEHVVALLDEGVGTTGSRGQRQDHPGQQRNQRGGAAVPGARAVRAFLSPESHRVPRSGCLEGSGWGLQLIAYKYR
ncbi:hypothetical protein FQZ97_912600 [compost metagenome]